MFAARNMTFARPVAGGGGGFDPLSLSPSLWLDASDSSTLYDATTGGSLVAADGTVARWEDKSGNARHATQSTSGSRPQRKTSVQNGKDIVRFEDDSLSLPNFLSGSSGTIVIVTKTANDPAISGGTAGCPIPIWGAADGESHYPWVDGVVYDAWGTNDRKTCGNPSASLASPHITSILSAASNWRMWINTSLLFSTTSNAVTWGATPSIGRSTGAYLYRGDILEILFFQSTLSDADRGNVESYLNAKWAIY